MAADGRVALITGGARGIGRAVGLDLASQGWSIAVCYRTSAEDADATCSEIESQGGKALGVQCDVSDPAAAESFVRQAEQKWGRIDALINCAGPYHRVDILKETPEGWREMFANNLDPVFFMSRLEVVRSEEHTSELQSPDHLVCRLLLEKKKDTKIHPPPNSLPLSTHCHLAYLR